MAANSTQLSFAIMTLSSFDKLLENLVANGFTSRTFNDHLFKNRFVAALGQTPKSSKQHNQIIKMIPSYWTRRFLFLTPTTIEKSQMLDLLFSTMKIEISLIPILSGGD